MQRAAAAPGDPQSYPAAPDVFIEQRDGGLVAACFFAMASPCELLLDTGDLEQAQRIGLVAAGEAARIEAKFSRYRSDSVVSAINRSAGTTVELDAETAALIDYEAQIGRAHV